ncbi:MAG: leucine-rich repeat protein, partial [Clostridia bacterium]|nr:leucine-rich repeat protein [Clostridia bacterium]
SATLTEIGDFAFALSDASDASSGLAESLEGTAFNCDEDSALYTWVAKRGEVSSSAKNGECGDAATWSISEDYKTLTVSGSGALYDYTEESQAPWASYAGTITTVVIDKGITYIGDEAFKNLAALNAITISSSVTAIGDSAFYGCLALQSLKLYSNTAIIGENAFYNCAESLTIQGQTVHTPLNGTKQGNTTITVENVGEVKILFIGNSYSQGLYQRMQIVGTRLGMGDITIGLVYHPGQTLNFYQQWIEGTTTPNITWNNYQERTPEGLDSWQIDNALDALTLRDWDYVILQPFGTEAGTTGSNTVGASGEAKETTVADSKADMEYLVKWVKDNVTNSNVKLGYYGIWSRWDITDAQKLDIWQDYVDAYTEKEFDELFDFYLPAGTAVQNARLNCYGSEDFKVSSADNLHITSEGNGLVAYTFYKTMFNSGLESLSASAGNVNEVKNALYVAMANATAANPSKVTYAVVTDTNGNKTYHETLASAVAAADSGETLDVLGACKNDTKLSVASGVTVKMYGTVANHTVVLNQGGTITATGLQANANCVLDSVTNNNTVILIDAATGNISYADAVISYDVEGKSASVCASETKSATVIFASYDNAGVLTSVSVQREDLAAGENTITANDTFVPTGEKVVVMLWNSISDMVPICIPTSTAL